MADPLHERITAALDGTTPGPWKRDGAEITAYHGGTTVAFIEAQYGPRARYSANADLIAAAPSLLAECARRLDPGDTDVARIVAELREYASDWMSINVDPDVLNAAADLLAQAFLDPQETT